MSAKCRLGILPLTPNEEMPLKYTGYIKLVRDVLDDGHARSSQYIMKSIAYNKNANLSEIKRYIKKAIKKMIEKGELIQVKGRGMIGSFKLK